MLMRYLAPLVMLGTLILGKLPAQTSQGPVGGSSAAAILERLDRLEKQNLELQNEIRKLRGELAQAQAEPSSVPDAGEPSVA